MTCKSLKVHKGIVGGKSLGPGTAYLCGLINGPIKIGVTARRPTKRVKFARTQLKNNNVQLYGCYYHPQAYLIEKFAHLYLRKYDIGSEWFSVNIPKAYKAIEKILEMLESPKEQPIPTGNWFQRFGISENSVRKCFGMCGDAVLREQPKRQSMSSKSVKKIADRWPLPSKEWPTKVLLDEAGVSLNTAKAHLGKRPIAQYNYQAAQKRKERRNAKAN